MPYKKKPWLENLEDAKAKDDLPKKFFCDKTKQDFFLPPPAQIERELRGIRKGKLEGEGHTFQKKGKKLVVAQ